MNGICNYKALKKMIFVIEHFYKAVCLAHIPTELLKDIFFNVFVKLRRLISQNEKMVLF